MAAFSNGLTLSSSTAPLRERVAIKGNRMKRSHQGWSSPCGLRAFTMHRDTWSIGM